MCELQHSLAHEDAKTSTGSSSYGFYISNFFSTSYLKNRATSICEKKSLRKTQRTQLQRGNGMDNVEVSVIDASANVMSLRNGTAANYSVLKVKGLPGQCSGVIPAGQGLIHVLLDVRQLPVAFLYIFFYQWV